MPGLQVADDVKIIDATGKYVMPGIFATKSCDSISKAF